MESFIPGQLKPRLTANPLVAQAPRAVPSITMGIKGLTKLLADHAPRCMVERNFDSYSGRKVAIDASMSIYQFLIVVGRKGTTTLTNEAGEVTSHLQGMFTRTIRLLEAGIKPLYIFDGSPPEMKKNEIMKRTLRRDSAIAGLNAALENGHNAEVEKYSKRIVKVTKQQNEDCRRLLQLMGVPSLQAPGEAEAECAALCKLGKVYAVSSEDMDALTFGSPKLLRYLLTPASRNLSVLELDLSMALDHLDLSMDQFVDVCILCGCDYCDTIKGIGPQKALKLVRQHGDLECVLESINKDRYQVPDLWPFQEVRRLFKDPLVTVPEDQWEPQWVGPDEQDLRSFLVDQNSFNPVRVMKAIDRIKTIRDKSL
ncbi:hypothetical protein GOP47_0013625 [Adiantum capillus-veneris]|uniref:Flap endonuclease 1 n=1 Tax=Adiantum capillus-veneris TaxID=13818 RepID=A0A9D4UNV9_ADICA|nr:hypothetical protein GOP47_0013625 [Adiantum capillus-veneris]